MKATISELGPDQTAVWQGEAVSVDWDGETGDFVISGDADDTALATVVASVAEKQELAIGIEDTENAQVVWRGRVGSAKFDALESGRLQCHLVLTLEDWFGIFPGFSRFYFD